MDKERIEDVTGAFTGLLHINKYHRPKFPILHTTVQYARLNIKVATPSCCQIMKERSASGD